jgi:prepilin-type N-terminal cleavage/methylation domain-containing protein
MNRKGFTIIELLIVVVVIGILATIAIPKFSATRDRSMISAIKTDLRNLASQQEIYFASGMLYASSVTDTQLTPTEGVVITINEATNVGWAATAYHMGLAGEQCGIFQGDASPAGASPATVERVVSCTR